MTYRSNDPLADFAAQDQADYEAEQRCPYAPTAASVSRRANPFLRHVSAISTSFSVRIAVENLTGNISPRWEDSYEQRTQMQVTNRAVLRAVAWILHYPHVRA